MVAKETPNPVDFSFPILPLKTLPFLSSWKITLDIVSSLASYLAITSPLIFKVASPFSFNNSNPLPGKVKLMYLPL